MEPTAGPRALPAEAAGELIIQTGPQSGLRRALIGPLILIGRAEWCDLRVDAEGVSPWHCVVARGEHGLVLRDLRSDTGTRVNGRSTATGMLRDGDVLTVGPLELLVRWTGSTVQEEHQHWLQLRDETQRERARLLQDRQRYEERVAEVQQNLARDRQAMAEQQKELRAQTERLLRVRRRVREHGRRHWACERARMEARQAALDQAQRELELDRARLDEQRRALQQREEALCQREQAVAEAERALESRSTGPLPAEAELEERLATLEALAGDLADQRLHIAEQCERLVHARQEWQREREAVVTELEVLGQQLHEREQALAAQEQAARTREQDLAQRGSELECSRRRLEADRARLLMQTAAWEGERERLLAELHTREQQLETFRHELADARQGGQRGALPDAETIKLRQQVESLGRQRSYHVRRVEELQEEVEHLARLLLEEAEGGPRLGQAA